MPDAAILQQKKHQTPNDAHQDLTPEDSVVC